MALWRRIRLLFSIKASSALDQVEDPRQTLEYAYAQQLELLRRVRRGLVDVATAKTQLERESRRLRARVPQLEDQAQRALDAGREDLARVALSRKQVALAELAGLDAQLQEVTEEERKLSVAEQRMTTAVEDFRTRRDIVAARYTAADARVRVNESLAGVSDELAELWQALQRAEDKTGRMQARASAIDALIESGALALSGPVGDHVERQLREIEAREAVEAELAALKARRDASALPPGPQPS